MTVESKFYSICVPCSTEDHENCLEVDAIEDGVIRCLCFDVDHQL